VSERGGDLLKKAKHGHFFERGRSVRADVDVAVRHQRDHGCQVGLLVAQDAEAEHGVGDDRHLLVVEEVHQRLPRDLIGKQ